MAEITNRDKQNCAMREVAQRTRVYMRLMNAGKMSEAKAAREIALMRAIADDYAKLAEADESKGRLICASARPGARAMMTGGSAR